MNVKKLNRNESKWDDFDLDIDNTKAIHFLDGTVNHKNGTNEYIHGCHIWDIDDMFKSVIYKSFEDNLIKEDYNIYDCSKDNSKYYVNKKLLKDIEFVGWAYYFKFKDNSIWSIPCGKNELSGFGIMNDKYDKCWTDKPYNIDKITLDNKNK